MASPAPAAVKPTKPDEEAYKISLAQAEKEHTAAQEKLVCYNITFPFFMLGDQCIALSPASVSLPGGDRFCDSTAYSVHN